MRERTFLSTTVVEGLRKQLSLEIYTKHLLLTYAQIAKDNGLLNLSLKLDSFAELEADDAKFINAHIEKGGIIMTYPAVEEVSIDINLDECCGVDLLDKVMELEIEQTKSLGELMQKCLDEKDFITFGKLLELIQRQAVREARIRNFTDVFKIADNDSIGDQGIINF